MLSYGLDIDFNSNVSFVWTVIIRILISFLCGCLDFTTFIIEVQDMRWAETAVGDKDLKYQIRLGTYTVKKYAEAKLAEAKEKGLDAIMVRV